MQEPKDTHRADLKQIFWYLCGTTSFGLRFTRATKQEQVGFSDSFHNVDNADGKSTTGHIFYLGDSPITWCSQK